ncbi:MAG TPA: R3H domain-containing nucleic acid-binding protein [Chloroflexota bacterium]|nr:R3H domain-containing nucleic acid-binding protein [Chloroflexota bacterium]
MTYHSYQRRSRSDDFRPRSDESRRGALPFGQRSASQLENPTPLPALPPLTPETVVQRQITDNIDALLDTLPPRIADPLRSMDDRDNLLEVVLDLGRVPEARFPGREIVVTSEEVTGADLDFVVSRIGEFGEDNRAGIERTLHRISCMRNRKGRIVGLTCRIGRAVYGTIAIIRDIIESGRSTLLLGRPGVGKTTMLREVARVLADDFKKRVVIVDTSNEIAGDGDIPHPGIGHARRMQVPRPNLQHAVMIEAVENHMPEVIIIDEIGTELESQAARTIAERGVQLVGTAHGTSLENLMLNPTLSDLIGGIQSVTLSDEEARRRGTQKSILERKAPPTFDVVVEIQSWDEVAVQPDVAVTVDAILRGRPVPAQLRTLQQTGEIKVEQAKSFVPEAPAPTASRPEPAPAPARVSRPTTPSRTLRIYAYGISHSRLDQAAQMLQLPVELVKDLQQADAVLTLKNYYRKRGTAIQEAEETGVPVYVLKSNTLVQVQQGLASLFDLDVPPDPVEAALAETQDAINHVLAAEQPVDLSPQNAYIRRLQHEMAEKYNLTSRSEGREPHRRVRIFNSTRE